MDEREIKKLYASLKRQAKSYGQEPMPYEEFAERVRKSSPKCGYGYIPADPPTPSERER